MNASRGNVRPTGNPLCLISMHCDKPWSLEVPRFGCPSFTSAMVASNDKPPTIEVDFSKQEYRAGKAVVGCIRIYDEDKQLRPVGVESVQVMAFGLCQLDTRWHKPSKNKSTQNSFLREYTKINEYSRCVWSTEVIELLSLPEQSDRWEWDRIRPKPIQLKEPLFENMKMAEITQSEEQPIRKLEHEQYSFTVAVDLPSDLPPSLTATSCRYSYHLLIRLQQSLKVNPYEPVHWKDVHFCVLSAPLHTDQVPQPLPNIIARAHSNGLPSTYLSATDAYCRLEGQIRVNHESSTMYAHKEVLQPASMRVEDTHGLLVGVLTLIGVTHTSPSSRCLIKMDFPVESETTVRCHQMCACLQGEETILASATATQQRRARSFLLDIAHTLVSDGSMSACLELLVPLDARYSVQTDVVDIAFQVVVDLTVESSTVVGGFQNLKLEIPCVIAPGTKEAEEVTGESTLEGRGNLEGDGAFPVVRLQEDLQVLSQVVARKCNLIS